MAALRLDRHCLDGQPVRGIGEPIWPGRRDTELLEAQLHEGLLNVAVDPDTPMWLRCPYDTKALPAPVIEHAYRAPSAGRPGRLVRGEPALRRRPVRHRLPRRRAAGADRAGRGPAVRGRGRGRARGGGPAGRDRGPGRGADLGGRARPAGDGGRGGPLRRHRDAAGVGGAGGAGLRDARPGRGTGAVGRRRRPAPSEPDDRGLWLANQLCDLVQVRSGGAGATVRVVSARQA